MKQRGWNQSELARRLGVPAATITNWKNRGLPPEHHKTIAELFGRSVDELLGLNRPNVIRSVAIGGTVHPVTRDGEPSSPPDWQDFGEPLRLPAARAVPVVGTAQLGDNGYYVELEFPVGNGDGAVLTITDDPNAYAVRCRGDSMQPRLQHGEFAVIEPNHEVAPGDEVLVKSTDGRVMIKRLRYQRDGRLYLDSVNDAAHPPVILEARDVAALHYVAAIVKSAYYRS